MAVSPDGKGFLVLANAGEKGDSEAVRPQIVFDATRAYP